MSEWMNEWMDIYLHSNKKCLHNKIYMQDNKAIAYTRVVDTNHNFFLWAISVTGLSTVMHCTLPTRSLDILYKSFVSASNILVWHSIIQAQKQQNTELLTKHTIPWIHHKSSWKCSAQAASQAVYIHAQQCILYDVTKTMITLIKQC